MGGAAAAAAAAGAGKSNGSAGAMHDDPDVLKRLRTTKVRRGLHTQRGLQLPAGVCSRMPLPSTAID